MAKIAVIGAGYVGLTTATCLSHLGHDVVCADVVEERVAALQAGKLPIHEAGLEGVMQSCMADGRLTFVLGAATASAGAEFHFLCVPTPESVDGAADLTYLTDAAAQIGPVLQTGSIIVNKSTVPVGTTRVVEEVVRREDISVVSNPEFLREGTAMNDFFNPDRIVIGCDDQEAAIRVSALYAKVSAPTVVTDPRSAETIKYASNAFLATKLSFVNAVANVCEHTGADIEDVVLGMGFDRRIGKDFLRPGPGWGGSCFPKDTVAFARIAEDAGYDFPMLREVIDVNERQFDRTAQKVIDALDGEIDGAKIAAWGLAFKAGTGDLRDSPAIEILKRLEAAGAEVAAYDPAITADVPALSNTAVVQDPYAACEGADALVVLTEWGEFRHLDADKVANAMTGQVVVDARGILDRSNWKKRGFHLIGIGF